MKPGETHCEVDPSPLYTSATYSVISPAQSTFPPDYNPGWDIQYPASQILWQPNPDAPACLRKADIRTMDDWIDWIQTNIVKIVCQWTKTPCMWMISGTLKPISDTLSECLKMSPDKYTVVYDPTGKVAISGEIFDASTCATFIEDMKRCIMNATALDEKSVRVLGHTGIESDLKPYWYRIATTPTSKQIHKINVASPNNTKSNVLSGDRMVPLAETPVLTNTLEGNTYNNATGTFTIAKEGFYRFQLATFVKVGYQTMGAQTGALAIAYLIGGIMIENGTAREEVRLYEQPFWREYATDVTQNLKMSYGGFFKAGTKITPRIWLGYYTGTINVVDMNMQPATSSISLMRIADRILFN